MCLIYLIASCVLVTLVQGQSRGPATYTTEECTIPFVYYDKVYYTCTSARDTKPWCATGPKNYVVGSRKWTYCCPTGCKKDCSELGGFKMDGHCKVCECKLPNPCTSGKSPCGDAKCTVKAGKAVCTCPANHHFDPVSKFCKVSDACKVGSPCGSATCTSKDGEAVCSCPSNHRYNKATKSCDVIDACKVGSPCGSATCTSKDGKAVCSCPSNYRYNSATKSCDVIDACKVGSPCGSAKCTSTNGKAVCSCPYNHKYNSGTKSCEIINPCIPSPCGSAQCVNSYGRATCRCPTNQKYNAVTKSCYGVCTNGKFYAAGSCYYFYRSGGSQGTAYSVCRSMGGSFANLAQGSAALNAVAKEAWQRWPLTSGVIRIVGQSGNRCATIRGYTQYRGLSWQNCNDRWVFVCKF